jgi:hypothetical protein
MDLEPLAKRCCQGDPGQIAAISVLPTPRYITRTWSRDESVGVVAEASEHARLSTDTSNRLQCYQNATAKTPTGLSGSCR